MDKIKTLIRLYKVYARLDLLWFLRDTKYCLMYIVSDLICTGSQAASVFLLSARFGGFGGMNEQEVLFMLGYAMLGEGIYTMFFTGNNSGMVSRIIGRGQLDHGMIQPVPLWMQLMAQGFLPISGNAAFICGTAILVYAAGRLHLILQPLWAAALVINAAASCAVMVLAVYLMSCLAFYAPAAAEEIAQAGRELFSLKSYPLGGIGKRAKIMFVSIIPIGLAAWLPSLGLVRLGRGFHGMNSVVLPLLFTPVVAGILAVVTGMVFKKGMEHYAVYGSPRYSSFGHR